MAKPKTSRVKRRTTLADVKVPVDRKLKQRWDALIAEIASAQHEGASAFDRLWEAVARVVEHDPPLYPIGGYADAPDFFERALHQNERTARRWIRVARHASPAEESRYGTSVLDAALGYLEAKLGPLDGPLPVDLSRLRIPVVRDGTTRGLLLTEVTVEEINAATRALAKAPKRSGATAAHRALRDALGGDKNLTAVRVHERDGVASFTHVPMSAIRAFGKALATVDVQKTASAAKKPAATKKPAAKKPAATKKPRRSV